MIYKVSFKKHIVINLEHFTYFYHKYGQIISQMIFLSIKLKCTLSDPSQNIL